MTKCKLLLTFQLQDLRKINLWSKKKKWGATEYCRKTIYKEIWIFCSIDSLKKFEVMQRVILIVYIAHSSYLKLIFSFHSACSWWYVKNKGETTKDPAKSRNMISDLVFKPKEQWSFMVRLCLFEKKNLQIVSVNSSQK